MMSLGPPAGNGTISRNGFAGNSCAVANAGSNSRDSAVDNVLSVRINTRFHLVRVIAVAAHQSAARLQLITSEESVRSSMDFSSAEANTIFSRRIALLA